jgi:hypothetical protein
MWHHTTNAAKLQDSEIQGEQGVVKMNSKTAPAAWLIVLGFSTIATAQDGTFRTWFETPDTVDAGDTFTATLWVTFESNTIDLSEAYFGWIETNVVATSGVDIVTGFSQAYGHHMTVGGTPSGDMLIGVIAEQFGPWLFNPFPDIRPSVQAFSFDVSTQPGVFGDIILDLAGPPVFPESPHIGWWLELNDNTNVNVETPGIDLAIETATIRVIPAPGAGLLLAITGLGASRRRR